MKRLWWRLLDRLWPRYVVGFDPAYAASYEATVVGKWLRDGTFLLEEVEVVEVSDDR